MQGKEALEPLPSVAQSRARRHDGLWMTIWAFGAYFCMYGFRKPYTAGSYDGIAQQGIALKSAYIAAQTFGYMLSKWFGIRIVSSIADKEKAPAILILILLAWTALFGFAMLPYPFDIIMMMLNGIPLGLIYGMIVRFLEGRTRSEAMIAGLCSSFIIADGFAKSIGAGVLDKGVSDRWMPFVSAGLFLPCLVYFVFKLGRTAPPSREDVLARSPRQPMTNFDKKAFLRANSPGLQLILGSYMLVSLLRGLRADFTAEYWQLFHRQGDASLYTLTEIAVAICMLTLMGFLVRVRNHRAAFLLSHFLSLAGLGLIIVVSLTGRASTSPVFFMICTGLGLYLPYVAVHTAMFERMIAMNGTKGNIGFPMYIADSLGYTLYFIVLLLNWLFPHGRISTEQINTVFLLIATIAFTLMTGSLFLQLNIKSLIHVRKKHFRESNGIRGSGIPFQNDPSSDPQTRTR